jgi:hypothetical protein
LTITILAYIIKKENPGGSMNKGWVGIAEELEIHGRTFQPMLHLSYRAEAYFSAARALRNGDPLEAMVLYEEMFRELRGREDLRIWGEEAWIKPGLVYLRQILQDLGYDPELVREWWRRKHASTTAA